MNKGERIRQLREAMNMSQTELAAKIDVSKQTLYKYENNIVTNIPSDKIEALARVLNVTPSYIMAWNKDTPAAIEADSEQIARALELYERYKKANPEIQSAVEAILRASQRDP